MFKPGLKSGSRHLRGRAALAGGLIFLAALLVFFFSPVMQVTDSNYAMLLSQSLLDHQSFALDAYRLPRYEPRYSEWARYTSNGEIGLLEVADGRLYYYFPPGTSLLSAPFVAMMNLAGLRAAATPDGAHNQAAEIRMQKILAALLMAALALIFFRTCLMILPPGWSLTVALGGAFATPVWSTASRAMWSDTWSILLLGAGVLLLVAHETGRRSLNPFLLATLLAWMFFVRPTAAVAVVVATVYVFLYVRPIFVRYAATGAAWFGLFLLYSWSNFGQLLPSYYRGHRLWFNHIWVALPGNLISPSRGLLIFSPVLLFVFYLGARYRAHVPLRRLAAVACLATLLHLILVSGFVAWWGGFCYGPRYMTGAVPWLVLLAALGLRGWLDTRETGARRYARRRQTEVIIGAALLAVSILIHARGAVAEATWRWNWEPRHIDDAPERVWDGREPQFLAGLVARPARRLPLAPARVDFSHPEAGQYLRGGWSGAEAEFRWSDGHEAAIVFAAPEEAGDYVLELRLGAFIVAGHVPAQRVRLEMNGELIEELVLTEEAAREISIALPARVWRRGENTLRLALPNAAAPAGFGINADTRTLAVRVEWMRLRKLREDEAQR